MPIGAPWYRPEPKSAWTGRSAPIEAISVAEFLATGRRSTRWFHGLLRGKTGQRGAPRSGRPAVDAASPTRATRNTRAASGLTRLEATPRRPAALALAVVCDLRERRIPNAVTGPAALLALAFGGLEPAHLAAGAAAGAFLGIAAVVRPDGMGLGDAKLAGVMGSASARRWRSRS